ncbi:MAG: hypothetical protein R2708_26910 [Vicinamibacterales bacterium]
MRIEGKTFITTGGASGLGRAAAEAIGVAAGGHAVLVDVNGEVGAATEATIGARAKSSCARMSRARPRSRRPCGQRSRISACTAW